MTDQTNTEQTDLTEQAGQMAAEQNSETATPPQPASSAESTEPVVPVEPPKPLPQLFRLNVDHADHASPNLQFTWCLTREAVKALEEVDAKYPHLLIVAATKEKPEYSGCTCKDCEAAKSRGEEKFEWVQVDRQIYPLDQGYGQIQFTKANTFHVFAYVIWEGRHSSGTRREEIENLRKYEERKEQYPLEWSREINFNDPDHRNLRWHLSCFDRKEEIEVKIDPSLFANPLPGWAMWWTNLWFEGKSRDECSWRRRALLAFLGPQIVLVPIWIVLRALVCLVYAIGLGAFGYWAISLKPIIHPFKMDITMVNQTEQEKQRRRERSLLLDAMLTPILWPIFSGIVYGLVRFRGWIAHAATWSVTGIVRFLHNHSVAALLVGVLCTLIAVSLFRWFTMSDAEQHRKELVRRDSIRRTNQLISELRRAETARYYRERINPLACSAGGPKQASMMALPKSHRTVVVRWMDLKARVCKPFQT